MPTTLAVSMHLGEIDRLSAILAGADALAEELYEFHPDNKMLYLVYMIQLAEERTLKLRSEFDESAGKLRLAS